MNSQAGSSTTAATPINSSAGGGGNLPGLRVIQAGQGQNISQILSSGNVQTTQAGRIIVNQGGAQSLSSIGGGQQLRLVQRQGPNGQVQYVMASQTSSPAMKTVPVYQNASGASSSAVNLTGVQGSPAILGGNQKVQIV